MYHGILKSLPPPRIRTAMNRAARGDDEVPVRARRHRSPCTSRALTRTDRRRPGDSRQCRASSAVRGKARADWQDYTSF